MLPGHKQFELKELLLGKFAVMKGDVSMVEIQLSRNEENVLAIIRELYLTHKKRIPTNWIYDKTSREGMPNREVKTALMSLSTKELIYRDDLFWKPTFDLKQEQSINKAGIPFSLSKVAKCIKYINKPSKPNQILMNFIEIYGMPENVESFLRYIRTLGEDPTSCITRDADNKYWIKDKFCERNTTLQQFSAKGV